MHYRSLLLMTLSILINVSSLPAMSGAQPLDESQVLTPLILTQLSQPTQHGFVLIDYQNPDERVDQATQTDAPRLEDHQIATLIARSIKDQLPFITQPTIVISSNEATIKITIKLVVGTEEDIPDLLKIVMAGKIEGVLQTIIPHLKNVLSMFNDTRTPGMEAHCKFVNLRTFRIRAGRTNRYLNNALQKVSNKVECSVCLDDIEINKESIMLPCHHSFHPACITPWVLEEEKNTCPVCREEMNFPA